MNFTIRHARAIVFVLSIGASLTAGALFCDAKATEQSPAFSDLAQRAASVRELDERVRALTVDQKTKLGKDLASVLEKSSYAEIGTFLHEIQFLDTAHGVALDWNGRLHMTSDGGLTWTEKRLPLGGGVIGRMYQRFDVPPPPNAPFRNMHFADDRFGLIVGGTGILQSDDGGVTWQGLKSPTQFQLSAVYCSMAHTCWVSGGEAHAIFKRSRAHSAWSRQYSPVEGPIEELQFIGELVGWAITRHGEIIGTTDGGEHWNELFHDRTRVFFGVHFVDERVGWAVGSDAIVMRTDDGGRTWVDQELSLPPGIPSKEVGLRAVKFIDARRGWVAGLHGLIFATTDGGRTWALERYEEVSCSSCLSIYALAITEGPTIWAAGNAGNIVVSVDNGAFWLPVHGVVFQIYDATRRLMEQGQN